MHLLDGTGRYFAIPKAIADCRTFVLILSPDAQNSNWVRKELGKALDKGKIVIPFMIRNFKLNDTFDFLLENAQWCHAFTDRDAALKKMLAAVKAQQGTYRYTPQSSAASPKQTTPPPRQTTDTPKTPVTPLKSTGAQTKTRTTAKVSSGHTKISRFHYCLVVWGIFCSLTLLLGLVSYGLAQHTAMGNGAFFILGIGTFVLFFLLGAAHKKDRIWDWLWDIKRSSFFQKFLLWLFLTAGIFFALVVIGGLTYLRIAGQDQYSQNQIVLLALGSGIASLVMLVRLLKK